MISHFLKIALRHLRRHKLYSFANLAGLTMGLASCILIGLYVKYELSYDRFHQKADRIYRVVSTFEQNENPTAYASAPAPLGPALRDALPEVEEVVRFRASQTAPPRVSYAGQSFWEPGFLYADASVFDLFDFDLLRGDPATALSTPFSVVVTERTAHRYFGSADPMGRVLTLGDSTAYTITGVVATVPDNSHLTFDFLASLETDAAVLSNPNEWRNSGYYTYFLLAENTSRASISTKLRAIVPSVMPAEMPMVFSYEVQPLTAIHLHSHRRYELRSNARIEHIYLFGGIALLILGIVFLNYINLATAQAAQRAREVGVRKAFGAHRRQISAQFQGEALLLTSGSLGLALVLSFLVLPSFSTLMERTLSLSTLEPWVWFALVSAVLLVGLLAGGYPAFFLATLRPVQVLKGVFRPHAASTFRHGMVVVQLTIATVLIAGTLVVREQIQYVQQQPLGLDMEQIVALPMNDDPTVAARYEALKQAFLQQSAATQVTASSGTPGRPSTFYSNPVQIVGQEDWRTVRSLVADSDFVATYQLELLAGRLPKRVSEKRDGPYLQGDFLVNETLVQDFGWVIPEQALGQRLIWKGNVQGEIVGVISDFHFLGLQQPIEPVLIAGYTPMFNYLSVRLRTTDMSRTLTALEAEWKRILPAHPFDYFFVDADYARQYHDEARLDRLTSLFAGLAILLACLGLFGLAAYAAERRTREIGIRKVLGASVPQALLLLTAEFAKLSLLALVIATPIAYLAAHQWLADFAYHIDLGWKPFVLAGGLVLLLAMLAVSYRSLRAALAHPVHTLRYE